MFKFKLFNERVFKGRLPDDLEIVWTESLTRTAGRALLPSMQAELSGSKCRVELFCKVLTDEEKLKATLLHELCHVAQHYLEVNLPQ